jgi:hypothetical protein
VGVNVAVFDRQARPDPFHQMALGNDIAFCRNQLAKNVHRAAPQLNPNALARKLALLGIKKESTEDNPFAAHSSSSRSLLQNN